MTEQQQAEQHIEIQRVYVKESSFKTHGTPQLFRDQWTPNTHVDLNINHSELEKDHHEVVLSVKVIIKDEKDEEKISIDLHHAAIFHIIGFEQQIKDHLIGAYCPSVIFPYARATIANLASEGTLPPLNLAPINFDAVYQQQQKQQLEMVNNSTKH